MKRKITSTAVFIVIGLAAMVLWQELSFTDGKLHVVFCDVGQGDAIFIRTPNKTDILLDGGPDRGVLDCLSRNMPFWDRTIELMILSHPHQDHLAGLIDVLESYTVLSFANEKLVNESEGFRQFLQTLKDKRLTPRYVFAGDTLKTGDGVVLTILAPSPEFLSRTSPGGTIGERSEFASLILLLSYGSFQGLFTSDSQVAQLAESLRQIREDVSLELFQVPHHGSKTGFEQGTLARISPKIAVISVGRNNRFGHPHEEVTKILRDEDIRILRTDQEGEIEIVTDGETWKVRR